MRLEIPTLHPTDMQPTIRKLQLLAATFGFLWLSQMPSVADDGIEFFEKHIRPVLVEHCYECHSASAKEQGGGLLLDSQLSAASSGDSGPSFDTQDPKASLLIKALRHQGLQMPPEKRLPEETAQRFEHWIAMGMPDPRTESTKVTKHANFDWNEAKNFWTFQPRKPLCVPVKSIAWGNNSVDAFIAAKHLEHGLEHSPAADRHTWLRRVYLDLIGIPPTVDEVNTFVASTEPDSYDQVVDQLLASPSYGERWGRHWLDLARYADSNGADENHRYPNAWRYRDYVIDAYNRDLPYDQFVTEQLAGDLLPANSESEQRRLLTATGFLVIGPKMLAEQDKPKLVADLVDEQIDTIGKVFLGLSLGCARCHDHKFDPILAADYYALAGILHSTQSMEHLNHVAQWNERELPDTQQVQRIQEHEKQLEEARAQLQSDKRNYRERIVTQQFHHALAAMHLAVANSAATSAPKLAIGNADKWNALLAPTEAKPGPEDLLHVWHRLAAIPSDRFAEAANALWQEMKSTTSGPTPIYSLFAKQPAPTSPLELIHTYAIVLKAAGVEVLSAQRNAAGAIESPDVQKTFNALFANNKYFEFPDKLEERLPEDERSKFVELTALVDRFEKQKPLMPKAMAVKDAAVRLVAVNVRGNHLQTIGSPLDRDVPKVFRENSDGPPLTIPEPTSGRLELSRWMTNPSNPLTARVIVNRVWQGHFGVGLVPTASNFGLRGQSPSHPELLDWLANRFVENGWSMKWLHREIVLSASYRMSSNHNQAMHQRDPDNKWLWRQNRHRMEAELLRDSLLAIAEVLESNRGGDSINVTTPTSPKVVGAGQIGNMRRSVYLDVNRASMSDFLTTFDYVEPGSTVDKRSATIVPHQALFLMNNPMPLEIGRQLAVRVHNAYSNDFDRLRLVSKIVYSREPSQSEFDSLKSFLNKSSSNAPASNELVTMNSTLEQWVKVCRSLLLTNEFLYVE